MEIIVIDSSSDHEDDTNSNQTDPLAIEPDISNSLNTKNSVIKKVSGKTQPPATSTESSNESESVNSDILFSRVMLKSFTSHQLI